VSEPLIKYLSSYTYLPEHGVGYFFAINTGNPAAFSKIREFPRSYVTAI
jgi:hypothetical protein